MPRVPPCVSCSGSTQSLRSDFGTWNRCCAATLAAVGPAQAPCHLVAPAPFASASAAILLRSQAAALQQERLRLP